MCNWKMWTCEDEDENYCCDTISELMHMIYKTLNVKLHLVYNPHVKVIALIEAQRQACGMCLLFCDENVSEHCSIWNLTGI